MDRWTDTVWAEPGAVSGVLPLPGPGQEDGPNTTGLPGQGALRSRWAPSGTARPADAPRERSSTRGLVGSLPGGLTSPGVSTRHMRGLSKKSPGASGRDNPWASDAPSPP